MKEYLRGLDILSDLSDEEIDLLSRTAEEESYPADRPIVTKDLPGDAAFILKEGSAEALIEKPGREPLRLSKIAPGEMFGELALFDGSPRSATVVATTDCTVVRIDRGAFLEEVARNPATALRMLSVIAKRLRRAETVVSDFSDRIYGDVMPRLQQAVSAQLDSAKVICEESRTRTDSTLARASHIQETIDTHWKVLTRVVSLVGILLTFLLSGLAWFGYNEFDQAIEAEVTEIRKLRTDVEKVKGEADDHLRKVKRELPDLEVMRETILELDKMRRDLHIDSGIAEAQPAGSSGYAARNFVAARTRLVDEYLERPERWELPILIEALELFVGTVELENMKVTKDEWHASIDTVIEALKESETAEHWRQRTKLNEVAIRLWELMGDRNYKEGRRALNRRIEAGLESGPQEFKPGAARQAATVLAALGNDSEEVKTELRALLDHKSPWRRSRAAVDLILLGEAAGWQVLRTDLVVQFAAGSSPSLEDTASDNKRDVDKLVPLESFVAAYRILEGSQRSVAGAGRFVHSLSAKDADAELSSDRLAGGVGDDGFWADKEQLAGAELVCKTIEEGWREGQQQHYWGRLYWQRTCSLLCDFGCTLDGETDGGEWCADYLAEVREPGTGCGGISGGRELSGASGNTSAAD